MATATAWTYMLGGTIDYETGARYRSRYFKSGNGDEPPLLLLHGLGGHAETYVKNVVALSELLGDRSVYAIDFIGHGLSDKPTDVRYNTDAYVEQVMDFLDAIGHDSAHIHGESLGGLVAARCAIDREACVESLGLYTPAGLNKFAPDEISEDVQSESEDAVSDLYERTMQMIEGGVTRETVRHRLNWLFVDEADDELVEIRYQIYNRPDVLEVMPLLYEPSRDNDREYYSKDELRNLDVPTLFIHTEHNPSGQKEQAIYANELLPNSTFYLYENSAHWPQYEEPERFNEDTAAFVNSLG